MAQKGHINHIEHMVRMLKDLGQLLFIIKIITKILMSLLLGYNSIVAAWAPLITQCQQSRPDFFSSCILLNNITRRMSRILLILLVVQ